MHSTDVEETSARFKYTRFSFRSIAPPSSTDKHQLRIYGAIPVPTRFYSPLPSPVPSTPVFSHSPSPFEWERELETGNGNGSGNERALSGCLSVFKDLRIYIVFGSVLRVYSSSVIHGQTSATNPAPIPVRILIPIFRFPFTLPFPFPFPFAVPLCSSRDKLVMRLRFLICHGFQTPTAFL